jgi:hypothetical protein
MHRMDCLAQSCALTCVARRSDTMPSRKATASD